MKNKILILMTVFLVLLMSSVMAYPVCTDTLPDNPCQVGNYENVNVQSGTYTNYEIYTLGEFHGFEIQSSPNTFTDSKIYWNSTANSDIFFRCGDCQIDVDIEVGEHINLYDPDEWGNKIIWAEPDWGVGLPYTYKINFLNPYHERIGLYSQVFDGFFAGTGGSEQFSVFIGTSIESQDRQYFSGHINTDVDYKGGVVTPNEHYYIYVGSRGFREVEGRLWFGGLPSNGADYFVYHNGVEQLTERFSDPAMDMITYPADTGTSWLRIDTHDVSGVWEIIQFGSYPSEYLNIDHYRNECDPDFIDAPCNAQDVFPIADSVIDEQVIYVGNDFGCGFDNFGESLQITNSSIYVVPPRDFDVSDCNFWFNWNSVGTTPTFKDNTIYLAKNYSNVDFVQVELIGNLPDDISFNLENMGNYTTKLYLETEHFAVETQTQYDTGTCNPLIDGTIKAKGEFRDMFYYEPTGAYGSITLPSENFGELNGSLALVFKGITDDENQDLFVDGVLAVEGVDYVCRDNAGSQVRIIPLHLSNWTLGGGTPVVPNIAPVVTNANLSYDPVSGTLDGYCKAYDSENSLLNITARYYYDGTLYETINVNDVTNNTYTSAIDQEVNGDNIVIECQAFDGENYSNKINSSSLNLSNHLIHHFSFENQDLTNNVSSNHNLTVAGTPTYSLDTPTGTGYALDTTSGYGYLTSLLLDKNRGYTWTFWVKDTSPANGFFYTYSGDGFYSNGHINSNNIICYYQRNDPYTQSDRGTSLSNLNYTGNWQFVACRGSTLWADYQTWSSNLPNYGSEAVHQFTLGGKGGTLRYTGLMDDFKIYSGSLSNDELSQLENISFVDTPPTKVNFIKPNSTDVITLNSTNQSIFFDWTESIDINGHSVTYDLSIDDIFLYDLASGLSNHYHYHNMNKDDFIRGSYDIIVTATANGLSNVSVSNYTFDICVSDWVKYNGTCANNTLTQFYLDSYSCPEVYDVPLDNGTVIACDLYEPDTVINTGEITNKISDESILMLVFVFITIVLIALSILVSPLFLSLLGFLFVLTPFMIIPLVMATPLLIINIVVIVTGLLMITGGVLWSMDKR